MASPEFEWPSSHHPERRWTLLSPTVIALRVLNTTPETVADCRIKPIGRIYGTMLSSSDIFRTTDHASVITSTHGREFEGPAELCGG